MQTAQTSHTSSSPSMVRLRRSSARTAIRNGTAWIVFSKKAPLGASALENYTSDLLTGAFKEMENTKDSTVIRLPLAPRAGLQVTRGDKDNAWTVTVTRGSIPPRERLKIGVHTDPPALSYLLVPALEPAAAVTVTDPEVGDDILVLPTYTPGQGISPERAYVECKILASAQGIAVQKIADDVMMTRERGGVRLTRPRGLNLTSALDTPDAPKESNAPPPGSTLFDWATWKTPEKIRFRDAASDLRRDISLADGEAKSQLRLKLAQLYLGEGLATEALGELQEIHRADEPFYTRERASALSGAANFLLYRFSESARDFAAPELNDAAEIAYWRAMTAELLGTPLQNFDYLADYDEFISKYPPLFQQRLAIVAADRAVAAKEYNTGLKIVLKLCLKNGFFIY